MDDHIGEVYRHCPTIAAYWRQMCALPKVQGLAVELWFSRSLANMLIGFLGAKYAR